MSDEHELTDLIDLLNQIDQLLSPEYVERKLREVLNKVAEPGAGPGMPDCWPEP